MKDETAHKIEHNPNKDQSSLGLFYAMGAYLIWSGLPFYMKVVDHISPFEVVAHRIIWSIPVAMVLLIIMGRTSDIVPALSKPKTLMLIGLSAMFITFNWTTYVWAVMAERTLETALGYYINPLVNVLAGYFLLNEKLKPAQWVAVSLATIAVIIITISTGVIPWVALVLAFSFASYGYIRKTVDLGPAQGFFLEVIILAILAVPFVTWLQVKGEGHFFASFDDGLLLMLAGPLTAIPLILFASGARRLRFSTVGILQYIIPTNLFFISVFIFHEPFNHWQLIAFVFIWAAVILYSWSSMRSRQ